MSEQANTVAFRQRSITLALWPHLIDDRERWDTYARLTDENMSEGKFTDWIHRAMAEKADIDERIERLSVFLLSADSIPVGQTQKHLLVTQLQIMQSYSTVLGARLDDAKGK